MFAVINLKLGWGTWTRTTIKGVKVPYPAIRRSPNKLVREVGVDTYKSNAVAGMLCSRGSTRAFHFATLTKLVVVEGNDPSTPVLSGLCSSSELNDYKLVKVPLRVSGHLQPINLVQVIGVEPILEAL